MFDRVFSFLYDHVQKRRWLVTGLTGMVIVISLIGLRFVAFDNNIELMLPGDEEVHRSMQFLRESNFSNKVILSLEMKSAEGTTQELISAVDRLAESLKPPMVKEVVTGISEVNMQEEMLSFMKDVPQLIDESRLSQIGREITPEGVQARLRGIYQQMLTPGSTFLMPFARSDPLGVASNVLRAFEKLPALLGYEVTIQNGHFVSADGRHAMMILDTPVALTDGFGSRELISYVRDRLQGLPPGISADIVAGHLHSISNEDVIKRDIRLTTIIASVGFLLLFLLGFRDARSILVFIMPMISVLISINLSYLILHKLSYFIIGMGTVIAGISIDYGIFVYLAVRTGGRSDVAKQLAKPVIVGALTTLGVFAAFFFSSVGGYNQLALFSSLSIVFCLAYALFLLPHFLSGKGKDAIPSPDTLPLVRRFPVPDTIRVAIYVALMICAGIPAMSTKFDNDVTQFDGTAPDIVQAENRFYEVWGGREKPAVFVVPGKTLEEALQQGERIYREATAAVGEENFSSLVSLWPSRATREANAARWERFWRRGHEEELRKYIREQGVQYDFSEEAFSPFFENLYAGLVIRDEPRGLSFFGKLKEQFVVKKQDGYQLLSFFPDEDRYRQALASVSARYPGTFVVSQSAFSHSLSRAVTSELIFLSAIAGVFILVTARLLLRNTPLTVLVMVPVFTGLLVILGIMSLLGLALNTPSILAAMVVTGIVSDYGIFMVYSYRYELKVGARASVSLAALTTLLGAGVLVFARHPVLFSIGVTMLAGVLAGYLSSLLIVPSLYRLWIQRGAGSA